MNTLYRRNWSGRNPSLTPPAFTIAIFAGICLLMQEAAWAGGAVTNCTEASLRAAIAGGGTVTFACDGTIILSNTITVPSDVVLDGAGHQVTLSGGRTVRVFCVNSNVNFTVVNLTIANGWCTNGAGVFNDGGTIGLLQVAFETNQAWVPDEKLIGPEGGAVFNRAGTVNATDCTFQGNLASPVPQIPTSGTWYDARGGAIRNESGVVNLDGCDFLGNKAFGGNFASSLYAVVANGVGGAIDNNGTLIATGCTFSENSALGAQGPDAVLGPPDFGGSGIGGAINNLGTMLIRESTFTNNFCVGASAGPAPGTLNNSIGPAGSWGTGGAVYNSGNLTIQRSLLCGNYAQGGAGGDSAINLYGAGLPGGAGGPGLGGAIYSFGSLAVLSVRDSTVVSNYARGAGGGAGGPGSQVDEGPFTIQGGKGGSGGNGQGGAIYSEFGSIWATNCTIACNSGVAGPGGLGGTGVWPGPSGTSGTAVGGIAADEIIAANTILVGNSPSNFLGTITDAGHNLSSDASSAFTAVGSMNNTDPKLGPLADNGGPTLTMALLPGSPAIDAGGTDGAPATDQRGVPRPQGSGVDIGAFEYLDSPIFLGATVQGAMNRQIQLSGLTPNQTLTLQASTNLLTWWDVTNFTSGANGAFQCVDPIPGDTQSRFYRLKSGAP